MGRAGDRTPQARGRGDADAVDGLCLGIGQAAALAPGVSRNGATLTAARLRGFTREQSNILSRTVALPVIVGAALLKGGRLRKRGVSPANRRALAAGTAASFASTLTSQALIGLVERDRALWPYALYRSGLATLTLAKLASERKRRSARARSPETNGSHPGNGAGAGGSIESVTGTGGLS